MLIPLSQLPLDSPGRVRSIDRDCSQTERRRLFDLGFVEGTPVRAELRSPGGDPTAYRIRGTLVALREELARTVRVEAADHD